MCVGFLQLIMPTCSVHVCIDRNMTPLFSTKTVSLADIFIPQISMLKLAVILFVGFASQGGRATVTYQPTPLKGDGQGCPSDEIIAQAIEDIHSLIKERVETESTPETRLLTDLNNAVESLTQEVAELANNSQTVNETLAELSEEVAELANNSPPASCRQIFEDRPSSPSGNYWIGGSSDAAALLFCDMSRQCCGETTGGWTRIALLDMTDPSQQCPLPWREITSPARVCARSDGSTSCESVHYSTHEISYNRVCGRVIGYEWCTTDGFVSTFNDIDSAYVDGVSITHGSPRQHVWTFASAFDERPQDITCPCISNPNSANDFVPSFVGNDYFCDTAFAINPHQCFSVTTNLRIDRQLWTGGCGPTGGCCVNNNPPWFCKTLPQPTTDDIEVRICGGSNFNDEEIPVQLIEIYVN